MSFELSDLPRHVFGSTYSYTRAVNYWDYSPSSARKYIEIPINKKTFEVPMLAMFDFIDLVENNNDKDIQALAVELYSQSHKLRYVSVDRYMRDVLVDSFKEHRLLICIAKYKDTIVKYYGTHGAVFNDALSPIAMCSWLMETVPCLPQEGSNSPFWKYRFIRPILRISPSTYINPQDSMEKYIVKKFINACLTTTVYLPKDTEGSRFLPTREDSNVVVPMVPVIHIEENPFNIVSVNEPTIDTTNEELRETALQHINEIV